LDAGFAGSLVATVTPHAATRRASPGLPPGILATCSSVTAFIVGQQVRCGATDPAQRPSGPANTLAGSCSEDGSTTRNLDLVNQAQSGTVRYRRSD